ncbi:MAG: heavy metal translocating P-type ATPase metal-binding domain-containing protein [SAR324 cluster bacterium]|nr:heavy metal translocating P-type ATPase metal-binding domain-containing protein [SAR324 cluster bacterium]
MNSSHPAKLVCVHCQLTMTSAEAILFEGESFCCHGCKGAWQMIQAAGLGSYYDKRESSPERPVQLPTSLFQSDSKSKSQITGEIKSAELLISGIHCAACVWLNEAYLLKIDGVISAAVNYSNHRAKVEWEEGKIDLSQLIHALASLGYRAVVYSPQSSEKHLAAQRLDDYRRFVVGIFAMMNIMWLSIAEWAGYFTGMEQNVKNLLHLAQFTLATPVVFYSGLPFIKGAWRGLKHASLGLDFQIAFSSLLIWGYSLFASVTQSGKTYFESTVMLITFVLGGKFLERLSLKNLYEFSSHLGNHLGGEATRVEGKKITSGPSEEIEVGWILRALAGERIMADGVIKQGIADFDESFLTGEAAAKTKKSGDEVYASSLNLNGPVDYLVTTKTDQSIAAKISQLVESAANSKPPLQQKADQIAKYFVPLVLGLALLNGWIWGWKEGLFEAGLIQFIALLVIACPCALSLATPIAYLVGIKEAASQGILFRKASVIEDLSSAKELFLDKTGTLTLGQPLVQKRWYSGIHEELILALSAQSRHPSARAVFNYLQSDFEAVTLKGTCQEIPGKGIFATEQGLFLGSLDWIKQSHRVPPEAEFFAQQELKLGRSLVAFGQGEVQAIFSLSDQIKPLVKETLKELEYLGLRPNLLTGDSLAPSQAVANQVGISQVNAAASPEEKLGKIKAAQKYTKVVMVGDGINDSPALAQADVGIAMGEGAQTAILASDLVLLRGEISGLLKARKIAVQVGHLVKQNLGISLIYNSLALSLAFLGLVTPPIAAGAMSLSSLLVVINAWAFGGRQMKRL